MDTRQLQYFVALAETGSFTAAARRCGIAQPSLSQQIATLERSLHQRLFDRLPRQTLLTAAGTDLLPRARAVLSAAEDLTRSAAARDATVRGPLTVAAAPTLAPFLFADIAATFLARFPEVRLTARELPADSLLAAVADGQIDIALLGRPVTDAALLVEPLFSEKILLAARPRHPLARLKEITPADLRRHPLILLEDLHDVTGQLAPFLHAQESPPLLCSGLQLATIEAMVAAGVGVCPMPAMARRHLPSPASIRLRPFAGAGPYRTVSAVSHRDRFRTRPALEFLAILRTLIAK